MEKVFELLEKNNLIDDEHIESIIMSQWSATHVFDFKDSLVELVEASALPRKELDLSDYAFIANSNMSAQHGGCCMGWECRLRRIDDLARFSVLYSDCVYVPNYFADYEHLPTKGYDKFHFRYYFAGDLKIMLRLKLLLMAGIVQFIYPGFHMCSSCFQKLTPTFKQLDSNLEKHVGALARSYVKQTSATLRSRLPRGHVYDIEIQCPEEIWEHGKVVLISEELPPPLKAKVKSTLDTILAKGVELSKDEIAKAGIVKRLLYVIARDIWLQYVKTRMAGLNLKYLTNRDIDISFLEAVTKDEDFKKYNDVLRSHLMYELPILQGVPLDSLLDIREKEHDAFLVYRDGINEVVRTYISQRKAFSPLDAKEVYRDVVQPKLNQLNASVNSIKRARWKKATRDIIIAGSMLTVGLCSNVLAPGWATVVFSLGGLQALKSVQSIMEARQTPEEIRNDNFYFLWKLTGKYK